MESAFAQATSSIEIEVVVVDDGSTDDSLRVLSNYGDRIKLISQANQGQVASINAGVANASGDVIIFLDSDDRLLDNKASKLLQVAGEKLLSATPTVIFDWYERIDAQGDRFKVRWSNT